MHVASIARSGWRRASSSIAARTAAEVAPTQAEILRQLSDVFAEIAKLSGAVGELEKRLADLGDSVSVLVDVENQSTELTGRLLAQARARIDALEEAGRPA